MIINQLFVKKPPIELINKLIKAFGLNDLNDSREFSQLDIEKNNTLELLKGFENDLLECYIPCKQKKYINDIKNITHKNAINIFRQFLKSHSFDLYSKEKFIKGTKYSVYKITTKQEKESKKTMKQPLKKEIIIVFD